MSVPVKTQFYFLRLLVLHHSSVLGVSYLAYSCFIRSLESVYTTYLKLSAYDVHNVSHSVAGAPAFPVTPFLFTVP